ncbi:unnamed protein product [Durusdinium trenchii]|uniref:Uncharacterized protein n=1 Tax=Durusdinium trenchii TaxID=1381693 RepID=A0ABP0QZN2_9DINO
MTSSSVAGDVCFCSSANARAQSFNMRESIWIGLEVGLETAPFSRKTEDLEDFEMDVENQLLETFRSWTPLPPHSHRASKPCVLLKWVPGKVSNYFRRDVVGVTCDYRGGFGSL